MDYVLDCFKAGRGGEVLSKSGATKGPWLEVGSHLLYTYGQHILVPKQFTIALNYFTLLPLSSKNNVVCWDKCHDFIAAQLIRNRRTRESENLKRHRAIIQG